MLQLKGRVKIKTIIVLYNFYKVVFRVYVVGLSVIGYNFSCNVLFLFSKYIKYTSTEPRTHLFSITSKFK